MENSKEIKRNGTASENFDNFILAQFLTIIILFLERGLGASSTQYCDFIFF